MGSCLPSERRLARQQQLASALRHAASRLSTARGRASWLSNGSVAAEPSACTSFVPREISDQRSPVERPS
jgi:hypothetical protein